MRVINEDNEIGEDATGDEIIKTPFELLHIV
jgi:sulfide:quinone oxidoreductase